MEIGQKLLDAVQQAYDNALDGLPDVSFAEQAEIMIRLVSSFGGAIVASFADQAAAVGALPRDRIATLALRQIADMMHAYALASPEEREPIQ